ncbi:MAG: succinate dehydrogenase cytochrome b subunit [Spirochaetia bacterium]|nr:succinate dehydrogenase cytochrome b subunit [Spirochaetia bacterium]
MKVIRFIISHSLTKKYIMALTGLFLITFLVVHLIGNLLLVIDTTGAKFNEYSSELKSSLFIQITEFILIFGFLFHVTDAAILYIKNKSARPVKYHVLKQGENIKLSSNFMYITGILILLFLFLHLYQFLFLGRILKSEILMHELVINAFKNPIYLFIYLIWLIFLFLHLKHAFQSAFQSLGLYHKKYTNIIKNIGSIYSFIVPAGFAFISIYLYLN